MFDIYWWFYLSPITSDPVSLSRLIRFAREAYIDAADRWSKLAGYVAEVDFEMGRLITLFLGQSVQHLHRPDPPMLGLARPGRIVQAAMRPVGSASRGRPTCSLYSRLSAAAGRH